MLAEIAIFHLKLIYLQKKRTKLKLMDMPKVYCFSLLLIIFCSCQEKKTNDPIQVYKYWSDAKPPKEIRVMHGRFNK